MSRDAEVFSFDEGIIVGVVPVDAQNGKVDGRYFCHEGNAGGRFLVFSLPEENVVAHSQDGVAEFEFGEHPCIWNEILELGALFEDPFFDVYIELELTHF